MPAKRAAGSLPPRAWMWRPKTVRVRISQVISASTPNTATGIDTFSRTVLKSGSETLISALFVGVRAAVLLSQSALAKLRRPTSVARVAMKGGRRIDVISQVWSVPTRNPTSRLAMQAIITMSGPTGFIPIICRGANASMVVAQVVPESAIIEPAERSMPPAMITTVAPRAKMPRRAVLRAMSRMLSNGSNQ